MTFDALCHTAVACDERTTSLLDRLNVLPLQFLQRLLHFRIQAVKLLAQLHGVRIDLHPVFQQLLARRLGLCHQVLHDLGCGFILGFDMRIHHRRFEAKIPQLRQWL